jgi:hypothetical protein
MYGDTWVMVHKYCFWWVYEMLKVNNVICVCMSMYIYIYIHIHISTQCIQTQEGKLDLNVCICMYTCNVIETHNNKWLQHTWLNHVITTHVITWLQHTWLTSHNADCFLFFVIIWPDFFKGFLFLYIAAVLCPYLYVHTYVCTYKYGVVTVTLFRS